MDLTQYIERQEKTKLQRVFTCSVLLSRADMLNVLKHEAILIDGMYFEVPEKELLQCLLSKRFGEIRLDLIEITQTKDEPIKE